MKKLLVAPLLAALAMFVWGFVYYGLSGVPYKALQPAQDVGPALDKLFPTSGTYIVPDPRTEDEEEAKRLEKGPFATVHIKKGGMPMMDPVVLVKGFLLEWISCLLMAVALGVARVKGYTTRLTFIVLVGFLMAFFAHGGLAVWWHQDWSWHMRTIIHDTGAWLFAGLILSCSPKGKE